jgi:hypothetical protein
MRLLLLVSLLGAAVAASSCSSDPPANTCTQYAVPPGTDLTKPTVSYGTEVLPLFKRSCGLSSSCHSSPTGQRVFLGATNVTMSNTETRAKIVNVKAAALTSMDYVKPGDPVNSFLMRKMDGDLCPLKGQCVAGDCGKSMPENADLLPVAERDLVRRWIAQGAPDN